MRLLEVSSAGTSSPLSLDWESEGPRGDLRLTAVCSATRAVQPLLLPLIDSGCRLAC